MSDRLAALRLFARVAHLGSFSAAAREVGIPQSTASRTIATLERDVGATLLMRTTRAVTLTDVGAEFLNRVEPILADLEDAEHVARGGGDLRGLLRVGLGTSFAVREVLPRLVRFTDRHRSLRLDFVLEDQRQDLVVEGVDLAFRFGELQDSTAVARKILTWPRVLAAAPSYLAQSEMPKHPAELSAHSIILGPGSMGGQWSFRKSGTATSLSVQGRITVRGSEGATAAAVAGLGLLMAPLGACAAEIDQGKLVRVLPDWDAGSVDLSAIYPAGVSAKPAAKALAEFLVQELAARP